MSEPTPYNRGFMAGQQALTPRGRDYNPFDYPSAESSEWERGWKAGWKAKRP